MLESLNLYTTVVFQVSLYLHSAFGHSLYNVSSTQIMFLLEAISFHFLLNRKSAWMFSPVMKLRDFLFGSHNGRLLRFTLQ